MDDPTVLTSISKIVNKRKVNTKLNLDAIERDLINGGSGLKPQPIKDIDTELNELLQDIRTRPNIETVMMRPTSNNVGSRDNMIMPTIPKIINPPTAGSSKIQQFIQATPAEDVSDHDDDDELLQEDGDDDDMQSMDAMPAQPPKPAYYPPIPPPQPYTVGAQPMRHPVQVPTHSQSYAQEALQVYANEQNAEETFMEQERMEDLKEKMLADIDELRDELNADGINTNRIPEVNIDSPYDLVSKIHKQLKRKYDRSRCEDLGQGVMLAAARMVEMAFDGEKSYFGYRPDMTGWNRTVRSKMRRMRFEQSQIVSHMLESYNVSSAGRMGLELIPSAFLYSFSRREQHGKDNYTPDAPRAREDRSAALDDLRQFES